MSVFGPTRKSRDGRFRAAIRGIADVKRPPIPSSASPEILEPRRRHFGVPHRVLDVLVSQIRLQSPRIVPFVRQREAAGVPEHVRVSLEAQFGSLTGALYKPGKPCCGEGRTPLAGEHERRLGILLPL